MQPQTPAPEARHAPEISDFHIGSIDEKFLRLPEVMKIARVGKTAIYNAIKAGRFPRPVKLLGARAVAWKRSDLMAWMESRSTSK